MAKVVWTYIKDAENPLLNIRVATDAAGFDDNANRAAIARYLGVPENWVSGALDGRVHIYPDGKVIATIERVTMDIEYAQSEAGEAAGAF